MAQIRLRLLGGVYNDRVTPDIFMPLLGGVLLDTYPGVPGYRYFFLTVAAICAIGFVTSLLIYFKYVKTEKPLPLLIQ